MLAKKLFLTVHRLHEAITNLLMFFLLTYALASRYLFGCQLAQKKRHRPRYKGIPLIPLRFYGLIPNT